MKVSTRAAAYGIAGLVLAGGMIFSGSALGLLSTRSSGELTLLLTDPPSVPYGVSAVYVTYSDIALHAKGFGASGWITIYGQGMIDTMKLVNLSQTISTSAVPNLTYDVVALNISGARVEFMGTNYTARIAPTRLTVPIVGGLKISSSDLAAALIDIQLTVLNIGTQASPEFTIAAGARALQVPSSEVNESMRHVGNDFSFEGRGWFVSFNGNDSSRPALPGLTLTSDSFSTSITNVSPVPLLVRMIIVAPASGGVRMGGPLDSVSEDVVFAVGLDGSLVLLSRGPGEFESSLGGQGYLLAGGATHQFEYSGPITTLSGTRGITIGSTYDIIVMGSGVLITQTVVAS